MGPVIYHSVSSLQNDRTMMNMQTQICFDKSNKYSEHNNELLLKRLFNVKFNILQKTLLMLIRIS